MGVLRDPEKLLARREQPTRSPQAATEVGRPEGRRAKIPEDHLGDLSHSTSGRTRVANQPHPSRHAVTWRLQRALVNDIKTAAEQRGETVLALATRALTREITQTAGAAMNREALSRYPTPWSVEPGTAQILDVDGMGVGLEFEDADGRPDPALAELIVTSVNALAKP